MSELNCRYYEERYPAVGDIVMVKEVENCGIGSHAQLLEYNNVVGMRLLKEGERLSQLLSEVIYPLRVLRVDEDRGG